MVRSRTRQLYFHRHTGSDQFNIHIGSSGEHGFRFRFYVVVSNGVTASVTSVSAGLFVGALQGIPNLCDSNWSPLGDAVAEAGCSFQLTAATGNQIGVLVWPNLISTGDIQLSFTMTLSNPSTVPADGFTVVFGDPSLGATPTSEGAPGMGLGAKGIPGTVFGFDTYHNAGDPPVPYVGVGRGEARTI